MQAAGALLSAGESVFLQGQLKNKCSECEGIWLDAGELEAISRLEKSGLDKLFKIFKIRNDFGYWIYPKFLKGCV